MNESEAVILTLDTLDAYLQAQGHTIPIGTAGGRDDIDVPGVIIEEWEADRLRHRNGARNYAAPIVDQSGNETGREHHIFHEFVASILVRHTSELDRDNLLTDIRHAFITYEDAPKDLHADISEVSVGDPTPRALAFREPDWFQGGIELSFVFVERLNQDGNTLGSVTQSVEVQNPGVERDDEDATWIGRNL